MKITANHRRQVILNRIQTTGAVSISELSMQCNVSEMTVRRDLDRLALEGLVVRTHGGAVSLSSAGQLDLIEPSVNAREQQRRGAKERIARVARTQIAPGQSIAIDIGTTTFALSQLLNELPVRLFTSSIKIAANLADSQADVYVPCGRIHGTEPSITGTRAIEYLLDFRFDVAFIGASGLATDGLYDYSPEDTEIKRVLIGQARKIIALMDASKFNRASVAKVATLNEIHTLVTDSPPPDPVTSALQEAEVDILIPND